MPPIIILDEATSALDSESETAIQNNLAEILGDRSAIVVAHRMSTIRNADKIVVLDDGRIVETGRHADLMAHRGLYHRLVSQQVAV